MKLKYISINFTLKYIYVRQVIIFSVPFVCQWIFPTYSRDNSVRYFHALARLSESKILRFAWLFYGFRLIKCLYSYFPLYICYMRFYNTTSYKHILKYSFPQKQTVGIFKFVKCKWDWINSMHINKYTHYLKTMCPSK